MHVSAVVGSLTAGEIALKAMSTICKDPERRLADPVLDERDEHGGENGVEANVSTTSRIE